MHKISCIHINFEKGSILKKYDIDKKILIQILMDKSVLQTCDLYSQGDNFNDHLIESVHAMLDQTLATKRDVFVNYFGCQKRGEGHVLSWPNGFSPSILIKHVLVKVPKEKILNSIRVNCCKLGLSFGQ